MRLKRKIVNPIPKLSDNRYLSLFEKHQIDFVPELKVVELNNVFVSHEGLCLKNLILLPYSTFNIRTKHDKSFGWEYYKLIMEQYLVSTYGNSLIKIRLDNEKKHGLIHTKWFNYSFWITSALVRLNKLCETKETFNLIWPEGWNNISYIQESLLAFPNIRKTIIPKGVHMQVKHLMLPEVRPYTACFDPSDLALVYDRIVTYFQENIDAKTLPKRIYLTRKMAKYRKIENEQELISLLERFKFTVVDFDELDFWSQVAYMQSADVFMSLHGAGFSNILFMKPGKKVIEIINSTYAKHEYSFPFWKLANAKQLKYFPFFGTPLNNQIRLMSPVSNIDEHEFLVNQNVFVDIPNLHKYLNCIFV